MLTEICQFLRNWFERDKLTGRFAVSSGGITYADGTALSILDGQYYRVVGSVLNDGVHQQGEALVDEPEFVGAVWLMAVPPEFLDMVHEIESWIADNEKAINSPYTSESFGGYSYSLRSGSGSNGATGATWQNQFSNRLSPWRKI